eukprot:scaffold2387_cov106-Amphora_coffeaeformis.AAC.1
MWSCVSPAGTSRHRNYYGAFDFLESPAAFLSTFGPTDQPTSPLSAPPKLFLPPIAHQGPRTASPPTPTPTRATPVAFPGPSLVASIVALNTPSYPTAPGPSALRSMTPPPRLGSSANSLPTNPNNASSMTMGNPCNKGPTRRSSTPHHLLDPAPPSLPLRPSHPTTATLTLLQHHAPSATVSLSSTSNPWPIPSLPSLPPARRPFLSPSTSPCPPLTSPLVPLGLVITRSSSIFVHM